MENIIFACDESGAKGYADQGEASDGEVGVFAGVMVSGGQLAAVEADFGAIQEKYKPAADKLHIAELPPSSQDALRRDIYDAIRKHRLPCFWYAVHVAGLHERHLAFQAQLAKSKAVVQANAPEPGRFKGGSPRENPPSMHVLLFEGLYAHLVAFLEERDRQDVEIEVRTDRVDSPIVKRFEEIARELLREEATEEIVKRFDTLTSSIVGRNIRLELHIPPNMTINLRVKSLELREVDNDDGIVLAADVLANHLNYLFTNRDAAEKYGPLNTAAAVSKHPLADHLDAFLNWGSGDLLGDRLYRHPKAPP